jgi:hypothetical protein
VVHLDRFWAVIELMVDKTRKDKGIRAVVMAPVFTLSTGCMANEEARTPVDAEAKMF